MSKIEVYNDVARQIAAVIEGETSVTARYATAVFPLVKVFAVLARKKAKRLL